MIDMGLVAVLMLFLVMSTLAAHGWEIGCLQNRENWWWASILLVEALLVENWYAKALMLTIFFGLFRIGRSWFVLRMFLVPVVGIAGAYTLVTPHMTPAMIPPLLWTGAAIGGVLGVWTLLGWQHYDGFEYHLPKQRWWGYWWIGEDGPPKQCYATRTLCGQANPMHLVTLSFLCVVCSGALFVSSSWWAFPLVALSVLPSVAVRRNDPSGHIGQQELLLGAVLMGLLALWSLWMALALGLIAIVAVLRYARPWDPTAKRMDQFRFPYWRDAVTLVWWPNGWKTRLLGFGACTWFPTTVLMAHDRKHEQLLTAAHNEFLQFLHEYGIVGLAVLLAYYGEALWRTAHGGPEGMAVYLLGCVMAGSALVNFPWTFFHEFHSATQNELCWFGSPTLNVWAIMIAIMAEAF